MGKVSRFVALLRATYLGSFVLGLVMLLIGGLLAPSVKAARTAQSPGFVYVARFDLAITPVSAEYYDRAISTAERDGATALVVELDTPGGLVDSMQTMVQRTLASSVPVIVYVSPQGAMSASAGIFIVYASHVAAMAPNTTIGSAEVILNAGDDTGSATPESGDAAAERRKVTNLLISQITNLAEQRGRDVDFGVKAVTESENIGATAALQQKVVDIVATNVDDVLAQADGRVVKVGNDNEDVTLHTKGAALRSLEPTLGENLLLLITDPNVAFLLISIGTLGVTWEFINPGSVFPGVVGAICLLIGFLGLGTLPINWSGAVFLVLAFVLFIADVFMTSHGILTAGGIASLILGGLLLINTSDSPGLPSVSPSVVLGTAAGLGGFFFFAVYKVLQARRYRPTTGREGLVGRTAITRSDLSPDGMVFVEGELWHATSDNGAIPSGQRVRVVATNGLRLRVRPETAPQPEAEPAGLDTHKL